MALGDKSYRWIILMFRNNQPVMGDRTDCGKKAAAAFLFYFFVREAIYFCAFLANGSSGYFSVIFV